MNTKIVSIVNQKGGVAKTTTAINVACALSLMNKKVLLIDFDPQSNASSGLGINVHDESLKNIYQLLLNEINITDVIQQTKIKNFDIIPCGVDLAAAEVDLVDVQNREYVLKNTISSLIGKYDFVFIDCPPSLSLLTVNALTASNTILIPLQCEYFALEGLAHLLDTAERIKINYNPSLNINGIILTMYNKKAILTNEVENEVRELFKDMVYNTTIPRNIKISEAPSHGMPVILYAPGCPGAISYMELTKEFLSRFK